MTSTFDEIDAAGQAVICDHLGESIALLGMDGGDYARGPDPARPQVATRGVVSLAPRIGKISQGLDNAKTRRIHASSEIWMTGQNFNALPWQPRKDDIALINPGTTGEKRFRIAMILPSGMGDVQLIINEESTPA